MSAFAHVAGDPTLDPPAAAPEVKRRSWTAYALMLPGVLWLCVFFLLPLVQLASVSLLAKRPGALRQRALGSGPDGLPGVLRVMSGDFVSGLAEPAALA